MASTKLAKMRASDTSARESIGASGPRLAPAPRAKVPDHLARLKTAELSAKAVPLDLVEPDPGQPRKTFDPDKLAELAASLGAGQLMPGMAYWFEETGKYRLVFGERRLRASAIAGRAEIDLKILPYVPDRREIRRLQRIENFQRQDLDPIEEALDYQRAIDDDGMSLQQIADEVGCEKARVGKIASLVKLPQPIRNCISEKAITPSAGYALSKLPVDQMLIVAERAIREDWTARQTEAEVKRRLKPLPDPDQRDVLPPPYAPEDNDRPVVSPGDGFDEFAAPPRASEVEVWRHWSISRMDFGVVTDRRRGAITKAGVYTLGALSDRLDGEGFLGLTPRDLEALRTEIDATRARFDAPRHPADKHIDRVNRRAESGRLAPEEGSPASPGETAPPSPTAWKPKPPRDSIKPHGPVEIASGSMVYTFQAEDGQSLTVMVHDGPSPGLEAIRILEASLIGARFALGPASVHPVGSRIVVDKEGSPYHRARGVVERYEDSGEMLWARLDEGPNTPAWTTFVPEEVRQARR